MNPQTLLEHIESLATSGSEFGPHYDAGSLSVTREIRERGCFTPNPVAAIFIGSLNPSAEALVAVEDDNEIGEATRILAAIGLTLDQGIQYARGVYHTERQLAAFRCESGAD